MPQYEVVRLGGGLPTGCPEFGVLAAAMLPDGLNPKEFAVRPVKDPEWRSREMARFDDGTYVKPPWPTWVLHDLEYNNPDHFLHVSVKDPTKVSFTENEDKGAIDRQSAPMSPGRYLERYARSRQYGTPTCLETDRSFLTPKQIREFASMLLQIDAMRFATTPDEIEHVYVNGPRSCMSGDASEFESPIHPARVYGAGDLAVAYLVAGEFIAARAVCWPEKKVYGRMYGDEHRLKVALEKAGYSEGSLCGAKLLRIENDDGHLVCPYIDWHGHVRDHGKHLTIEESGLCADSTSGLIMDLQQCDHCGDHYPEDDLRYFEYRGEQWCEHCISNNTFWCEGYDEMRPDGQHYDYVEGIGEVCEDYYEEHCYTCDKTHKHYRHADMDSVEMADGSTWSMRAFELHGGTCAQTDEHYPDDEMVRLEDTLEYVCQSWADEHAYEKDGEYYFSDPDEGEPELAEAA